MFLVNSRMGLFSAALISSRRKAGHRQGLPFSRSYGEILPSSLATFPSIALESSSYLPVSVCGTGASTSGTGFSWRHGIGPISTRCLGIRLGVAANFHRRPPTWLRRSQPSLRKAYPSPSPAALSVFGGVGMLTNCPSPTPFGLGLGPD